MTIPQEAKEHFDILVQEFESHGFALDTTLETAAEDAGLLGRIQSAFDDGNVNEGKDLIRSALKRHMESEIEKRREKANSMQEEAKELTDQAKRMGSFLQQTLAVPTAGGSLARPLGQNVNALRRYLGLSKLAFSKRVGGISRPSLRKMENGTGGHQTSMVESIAEEFEISPRLLFLSASELEALAEDCPLRLPINAASAYVHDRVDQGKGMDQETMKAVTHALEEDHDHLTSRGARAGGVIGWAESLPGGPAKGAGAVNRRLKAAVVGAHRGNQLAKSETGLSPSDDGFDPIIG
jgi:transcriptional regulator with XRE-family HTH domain